jgi:hypothetical protein
MAHVGSANWYLDMGTPNNDVAHDGIIRRFYRSGTVDSATSLGWVTVSFPSRRLIGYLYSIDDLADPDNVHASHPHAASLYFEGLEKADASAADSDSIIGEWDEIGIISLDKCMGKCTEIVQNLQDAQIQAELDSWTQDVLKLTGSEKDQCFIIEDVGFDRTVIQYNDSENQWQDKGTQFTDVIHDVANKTHYENFEEVQIWEQLRLTVKSVMNQIMLPERNVAMPDMQFFALPTKTINTGNVATVVYLKAADASGNLYDILGRHQRLPYRTYSSGQNGSSSFRFYVGGVNNSSNNRLYLTLQNQNGEMTAPANLVIGTSYLDLAVQHSSTDNITNLTYYEVYVISSNNEKVILSSGHTGVPS